MKFESLPTDRDRHHRVARCKQFDIKFNGIVYLIHIFYIAICKKTRLLYIKQPTAKF